MIVDKIFSENAGLIMDYQESLAELVGNRSWDLDTETGQITFGDGNDSIIRQIQLIGTYSELSNTWRWADANDGFSGPARLVEKIHKFRNQEELADVEPLKENGFELLGGISALNQWDLALLIGAIAKKPVFMCPYESGQLFVLVYDVPIREPLSASELVERFKESTQVLVYENQDVALEQYAEAHGYRCEKKDEAIAVVENEEQIWVNFQDGFLS